MRFLTALAAWLWLCLLPVSGQQNVNVYFGNLHSHTAYSDGTGTPQDAYEYARTKGKLDFLMISEHNHKAAEGTGTDPKKLHIARDHTLYEGPRTDSLMVTAARINEKFAGKFVALYGQEFSALANGNHINVFDVGKVIDENLVPNRNFRKLYDSWLLTNLDSFGSPVIVQFNHPSKLTEDYGMAQYGDVQAFVAAVGPHVRTVAIVSGPHDTKPGDPVVRNNQLKTDTYLQYLNMGLHVGPSADQDNHFITFGTATDHRTAVLAPALTKKDILQAIRGCHVYATQDKNLQVDFRVNGQIMGSTITAANGSPLSIVVTLRDPDEPGAHYHVSLRHDTVGGDLEAKSEVEAADRDGDGKVQFEDLKYTGGPEYYLAQIIQTGSGAPDQAWTAPVWIELGDANVDHESATTQPVTSAAGFVWSRNSQVYHLVGCRDAERISDANKMTGDTPPAGKTLHANCPR